MNTGDFLSIPGKADGWDAIISSFALHEVNPAQRLLAVSRLIRALRPGGMLALLDIMVASLAALIEAQAISDVGSIRDLPRHWRPRQSTP